MNQVAATELRKSKKTDYASCAVIDNRALYILGNFINAIANPHTRLSSWRPSASCAYQSLDNLNLTPVG